jgi:hypothetical protein
MNAEIIVTQGRHFLVVNGVYVAMESDVCPVRDPAIGARRWTPDALRQAAEMINSERRPNANARWIGAAARKDAARACAAEAGAEFPIIVTLCGSTRFWREFQAASLRETMAGKIVLSIGAASGTDDAHFGNLPRSAYDAIKADLDALHMRKIDLCDQVLILNCGQYIGESTARELAYAQKLGKRVRYLEEPV